VGQMGKEKCTGETKNTHKISVVNPGRKRKFERPRLR